MTTGSHETLGMEQPDPPSDRSTGLVFAGVCVVVAALVRSQAAISITWLIVAATFLLVALAVPNWLAPLNRAWFKLALSINRIMSPVIMFILFAGLIAPVGLLMQRFRDPLQRHRDKTRETYWLARPDGRHDASMRDQF